MSRKVTAIGGFGHSDAAGVEDDFGTRTPIVSGGEADGGTSEAKANHLVGAAGSVFLRVVDFQNVGSVNRLPLDAGVAALLELHTDGAAAVATLTRKADYVRRLAKMCRAVGAPLTPIELLASYRRARGVYFISPHSRQRTHPVKHHYDGFVSGHSCFC